MVSRCIDVKQKIISAIDFGQHELKSSNCPVRDKKKYHGMAHYYFCNITTIKPQNWYIVWKPGQPQTKWNGLQLLTLVWCDWHLINSIALIQAQLSGFFFFRRNDIETKCPTPVYKHETKVTKHETLMINCVKISKFSSEKLSHLWNFIETFKKNTGKMSRLLAPKWSLSYKYSIHLQNTCINKITTI